MSKRTTTLIRVDNSFEREIKDMQLKRITTSHKDSPLQKTTNSRITLAITRHGLFPKMKKDIIEADLK